MSNSYPLSDGTANITKALFPAGVTSYNQDYQQIEDDLERESLLRSLVVIKTTGIVAKKSEVNTKLFPSTVSGNQIKITAGVGMTPNGSILDIENDLTVNDITAVTGYSVPSSTNYVYVVLRKIAEDYTNRPHPILGTLKSTRRRFKTDNSIVQCISVVQNPASESIAPVTDRDVIVVGRLTSVAPAVFDTTEKTGGRAILRVTETQTMETGILNVMENDIDFVNIYNCLNFPQWGSAFWKKTGGTANKDFIRLFARVNHHVAVLRGVKFQAMTLPLTGYGIQFGNDTSVKIKILPAQQPPVSIDIIRTNEQVAIPDNHVLYLTLNDTQVFVTTGSGGGIGGGTTEEDSPSGTGQIGGTLSTASIATLNMGDSGGDLKRFPICWHSYNGVTGDRFLIFVDGTVLKVNDEVTNEGQHSAYLRRAGASVSNNYMTDNLEILKNSGKLILTQGSGSLTGNIASGISWRRYPPANNVVVAEFFRFISGGVTEDSLPPDVVDYDVVLSLYDNDGLNGKNFVFKKDGRMQGDSPATGEKDFLRLGEGLDKRGDSLSNNYMTGNFSVIKNNPQITLQDTTAGVGFQGIQFRKGDGGGIGYIERESESGTDTIFTNGWNAGDLLFSTTDNNGNNGKGFRLSRAEGHLDMPRFLARTDGTVSGTIYAEEVELFTVNAPNNTAYRRNITARYYSAPSVGISTVQLETDYPNVVGVQKLINYSDTTSLPVNFTITTGATPTYTGLAVSIPSASTVLVNINANGLLTGTGGASDGEIKFEVRSTASVSGSLIHSFVRPYSLTTATSVGFGLSESFVTNSITPDFYLLARLVNAVGTASLQLRNDSTGYSKMTAVVLT